MIGSRSERVKVSWKKGLEADISSFPCMGRKTASILTVNRDFSSDEVNKAVQKVSKKHSPCLMVFVNKDATAYAIVNLSSCPTFRKSVLHLLAEYYMDIKSKTVFSDYWPLTAIGFG
ncbi:uncharacterized protein LOC124112502 isoform X3 [Haliotis rufescens]|uniref:uncharacterized protein LOC124112502 isoform X3 n=1 Tax=Haliotis rufescens TaxID=6454 RepID=UPI001EAFAF38|nr:uncharacterized protein LOC124112502 isoform X3 [Haliotis rufescens]